MLGLSLWEGRLPGQKTIENEDKGSHCSYRPESNFGTMDTVTHLFVLLHLFVPAHPLFLLPVTGTQAVCSL